MYLFFVFFYVDAIPFRLNFLPVGRQFDDSLAIQQEIYDRYYICIQVSIDMKFYTWGFSRGIDFCVFTMLL